MGGQRHISSMEEIHVMAGPFRLPCKVQHSFPIAGTAQIGVIVWMPWEFALCGAALGWQWRQMTSGQQQRERRRFYLQNKPLKANTINAKAKKRFRLQNRRCHPQD